MLLPVETKEICRIESRGSVSDETILKHLAPMRQARVWTPSATREGATDVRIYRVMASGGRGAVIEFSGAR